MFSLFRKKQAPISLEEQLHALSACGITLAPGVLVEDLFMFQSREKHEEEPYKELIPTLGFEIERGSYSPICHRLWMCDFERIDDHGSYMTVISRLHQMSEACLPVSNIADYVDIEEEIAWIEFDLAGSRLHWDAKVDNDWLDPDIIVRFDNLLKHQQAPFRIYSNHADFGQSAFLACLTDREFEQFQKLATFKLQLIEKQA